MIGFNTFSNASGLACFAVSAQSQVDAMPTEWQGSAGGPGTLARDDRPAIPSLVDLAAISHASHMDVTSTSHPLDHVELEQVRQAVRSEAQGMLKSAARQVHDITLDILPSCTPIEGMDEVGGRDYQIVPDFEGFKTADDDAGEPVVMPPDRRRRSRSPEAPRYFPRRPLSRP